MQFVSMKGHCSKALIVYKMAIFDEAENYINQAF